jgi:hypothetical protein
MDSHLVSQIGIATKKIAKAFAKRAWKIALGQYHATYVGMSRPRESMDLFWSHEEFVNERDLSHSLSREYAKDVTSDYSKLRKEFSEQRGIEISDKLAKELQLNMPSDITKEKNFSIGGLQQHKKIVMN